MRLQRFLAVQDVINRNFLKSYSLLSWKTGVPVSSWWHEGTFLCHLWHLHPKWTYGLHRTDFPGCEFLYFPKGPCGSGTYLHRWHENRGQCEPHTWVWKKSCTKNRGKVFEKISLLIDAINKEVLGYFNLKLEKRQKYAIDYVSKLLEMYKKGTGLDGRRFHFKCKRAVNKNPYGRTEKIYECESCEGCQYKREYGPKASGNRTIRMNEGLTAIHQEVISNLESVHGALLRMNRSIQAERTFGILKRDKSYKRLFLIKCTLFYE